MNIFGAVERDPSSNHLDFDGDPDHDPDPAFLNRDRIQSDVQEFLKVFFDEILWRRGAWPKEQSVRFWWRLLQKAKNKT